MPQAPGILRLDQLLQTQTQLLPLAVLLPPPQMPDRMEVEGLEAGMSTPSNSLEMARSTSCT